MNALKILVVGAGSIGSRHIENLISLGVRLSVFRYRPELSNELREKYKLRVYHSLEDALDSEQDAVLIANRSDQHIPVAISAAKKGSHLFIEKPLSNNLEGVKELENIAGMKNLVVEIGCMMRFHPNLELIKKLLKKQVIGTPFMARSFVGQYLPEWRPDQDYRLSYSARKDFGGGVLFDLIHELDYLYWFFGLVKETSAFLDRVSDLAIETEDIAQVLLRFENGTVAQVEMDYLSPVYRRGCEIVGDKGVINWDYNSSEVKIWTKGKAKPEIYQKLSGFNRNDMYLDQLRHFLDRINNGGSPAVSLKEGIDVLKIALSCHQSSIRREVISLSGMNY